MNIDFKNLILIFKRMNKCNSNRFYEFKLADDLKNDLQCVVNWRKKWFVNFNTT